MRVTVVVPELEVGDVGPFSIGDEVVWALVVRSADAGPSWWFASEQPLDMRPARVINGNGESLTEYVADGVVAYHHAESDLTRIDALVRDDVLAATYVTEESVPLTRTKGVVRRIRRVVWKVERRGANMWDDTPQTYVMTDVDRRRFDEPKEAARRTVAPTPGKRREPTVSTRRHRWLAGRARGGWPV